MDRLLTFRLDDIAPGLKRDNLRRFESIFDAFGIQPILGIVPQNEDLNLIVDEKNDGLFWEEMRRLSDKGWKIALHGYRHVYGNDSGGLLRANQFSEFAGVSYEEQKDMICCGKAILEEQGLIPEFFMAPGHTFDENTLRALNVNGIYKITDGYADRPYIREGITFYPCRLSDPAIPNGIDTLCIHLNNWQDEDFKKFVEFLKSNRSICAGFDYIKERISPVPYDEAIAKQEDRYIRLKARKQRAAESEKMQRYLQKSYSDNRALKLLKRLIYMPMLLKR